MKPQRMRMTHELIKAYGLDKLMDVYVSLTPCGLPLEGCLKRPSATPHWPMLLIPALPCICPVLCLRCCLVLAAAYTGLAPAQGLQRPCWQRDRCCLQPPQGPQSLTMCFCCCSACAV